MVDPGLTRNNEKHRSVERSDEGDHEMQKKREMNRIGKEPTK